MMWLWISLSILGGLILLFIIFTLIFGSQFFKATFSRRKNDERFAELENPEDKKTPSRLWFSTQKLEELELCSKDNLRLKSYLLDNHSNKLAIMLHGYRGRYYSLTARTKILYEHGYDVLMPNNRAHDTSEGKYFSMGPKEVDDVLRWIDLMIKRNPNYQIVLVGASMGAHITMMTASNKNLPSNVKCFIEDCGYASLKDELRYEAKYAVHLPFPKYFVFAGEIYARLFHHFNFKDDTKVLKNAKIPGLFIHGSKDDYVPYTNLKRNADAMNKDIYKEVKTFDALHNKSITYLEEYKSLMIDYVDKFIK